MKRRPDGLDDMERIVAHGMRREWRLSLRDATERFEAGRRWTAERRGWSARELQRSLRAMRCDLTAVWA